MHLFASNPEKITMRLFNRHLVPFALPTIVVLALASPAFAQSQFSKPAQLGVNSPILLVQQQAAPAAAAPTPKAYKPVAVAPAAPAKDPTFDAFRKQLADVVKKKDRAALAQLVVSQGFFWEGESGDQADKKKSGIDNLAAAIALDDKDGFGWGALDAAAQDPTLEAYEQQKGVMCAPASPQFDEKALDELTKATQTDFSQWGIPVKVGVEVRGAAQPTAPVIDKLGGNLVWVMPEDAPPAGAAPPAFMRVVVPSGKVGYVSTDSIAPLASDQLCYLKDGSSWKIAGYVGVQ
jgi:hypothetical protein